MTPQERQTQLASQALSEAKRLTVGKVVKVVRGRKVPVGTQGRLGWVGDSRFGMRVGIDCGSERLWTALDNVEVANPADYMPDWQTIVDRSQHPIAGEDVRTIAEAREALAYWVAHHPQTLDYIGDYVRAEDEIAKAKARIGALTLAAGEQVGEAVFTQQAFGNTTTTVVRAPYADARLAAGGGSHAGLGYSL